ncbi:ketosteroid isomerase-like protein [Sphingobium subterraneum]|uniref:Ketosteroid isomerase-like protein n=2 Tax=Sphingobium subterraneum TaxID=627688 RepID=A0A841IXW7_9SPHN|nr:ketosteroid isomerase-like protein [Sphingobium subterraneum]
MRLKTTRTCARSIAFAVAFAVSVPLAPVSATAAVTKAETMSNRKIIADAFDKWTKGHGEVFNLLAPNAVLVIPGTGPSAGTWNGREQFLTQVAKPFLSRFSEPPLPIVRGIFAEGDTVVVHFDANAVRRDKQPYSNSYAWIFQMSGGLVTRLTMYYDLPAFDAVKAQVPASAETAGGEYRGAPGAVPGASDEADKQEIRRLATEWLEYGWRHLPTDPAFNFRERLGKFYDWDASGVYLFDDFDQKKRVARSPAEYGAIWDEALKGIVFSNRIEPVEDIVISGNLASAPVYYNITLDMGDRMMNGRILSMVVWHRTPAGWKIIREQGSGLSMTSTPKKK